MSLNHIVLMLCCRAQPSVRGRHAFADQLQFLPRKLEQMHRSGVVTSRCSSIAFADIDCCGTDEQVTAEGGGEQHAFGPVAWKRQNDVPKRVLKAAAFEHNKFALARDDVKRNTFQE
jgi:hypothetical protein